MIQLTHYQPIDLLQWFQKPAVPFILTMSSYLESKVLCNTFVSFWCNAALLWEKKITSGTVLVFKLHLVQNFLQIQKLKASQIKSAFSDIMLYH